MSMKRSTFTALIIGFLAVIAIAGWAQAQTAAPSSAGARVSTSDPPGNQAQDLPAWLQQLSLEVRKLRLELHQLQLELQQEKIAQLERELQQAQAEGRRLEERESELNRDLAELDQHLNQTTLTAEERKELEANKAELTGGQMEALRTRQHTLAQQEAELSARLEREQRRWQELAAKAKGESQ
jgi:Skp family chaperone for outer membrane proteins